MGFWTLGANWLVLGFIPEQNESRTWLYAVRLAAFVLILYGIWEKNRPRRGAER